MTRQFYESDIYKDLVLSARPNLDNELKKALSVTFGTTSSDAIIKVNKHLEVDLAYLQTLHKSAADLRMFKAIENGDIRFVFMKPEANIPKFIPFVFSPKNPTRIMVNATDYISRTTGNTRDDDTYMFGTRKANVLYTLAMSAYIAGNLLTKDYTPTSSVAGALADVWSSTYIAVLARLISTDGNSDKAAAFKYLAVKFFCIYYFGLNNQIASNIAKSLIPSGQNLQLEHMETVIDNLDLKPYEGVYSFTNTILNDAVSNIKALKTIDAVNSATFLSEFIKRYDYFSLDLLMCPAYQVFVMMDQHNLSRINTNRSLDDVMGVRKSPKIGKILDEMIYESGK